MAFRFPLQVVFHYRQSVEHQQELRLRAANQRVARAAHLIEQVDTRLKQLRIQQSRELVAGTTAAEWRFSAASEAALLQQRELMQRELQQLQALRDEQQKVFQHARRSRETVETLRKEQLRQYQREAARSEQQQLDEFFLTRQAYLRHG